MLLTQEPPEAFFKIKKNLILSPPHSLNHRGWARAFPWINNSVVYWKHFVRLTDVSLCPSFHCFGGVYNYWQVVEKSAPPPWTPPPPPHHLHTHTHADWDTHTRSTSAFRTSHTDTTTLPHSAQTHEHEDMHTRTHTRTHIRAEGFSYMDLSHNLDRHRAHH